LIGYNVNYLIPDLVEEIKTSTNAWIKKKKLSKFKFEWQKVNLSFYNVQPLRIFPLYSKSAISIH
jgi:hypothetical protein